MDALDPYLRDDPDHVAWALVVSIIKLHFDSLGTKLPAVKYESFRSCVTSYVDLIERATEESQRASDSQTAAGAAHGSEPDSSQRPHDQCT